MKKTLALGVMILPLGLAACGGSGSSSPAPAPAARPAPPTATAATPAAPAGGGAPTGNAAIRGQVKFTGEAPARPALSMTADPVCQKSHSGPVHSQEVVINDNGTLRHVFVHVKAGLEGKSYPVPAEPAVIDQRGCEYSPHMLGVRAGQKIKILNSDDTLHNVHALPTVNKQFNIAMPKYLKEKEVDFATPETMIRVKCEVHPWMGMWVGVLAHPYFSVSNDQGSFDLSGLPAGTYTIEAWHEKYGQQVQEVTLTGDEVKEISFTFAAS